MLVWYHTLITTSRLVTLISALWVNRPWVSHSLLSLNIYNFYMVATGQENGQASLNYFTVRETRERLFWVRRKSNYNTTDLVQMKTGRSISGNCDRNDVLSWLKSWIATFLNGRLKFYIHKIWEDVKTVVIGGFRPLVYLTFCIYLVQRF